MECDSASIDTKNEARAAYKRDKKCRMCGDMSCEGGHTTKGVKRPNVSVMAERG